MVSGPNTLFIISQMLGPDTRIGDGSWIGMGNVVYGEELPPNTRIENFAQPHGKRDLNSASSG